MILHESEFRMGAERIWRPNARTAGSCSCEDSLVLPDDRARCNLDLLYGGTGRRAGPVFAAKVRPEAGTEASLPGQAATWPA